nr:ABC transporter ATP-binding protein [Clostridia bacterium]
MSKIITMRKICKSYKTKYDRLDVLKSVDLEVEQGEFVMFSGNSGCGKTTLLNVIGFMDTYDSGSYIFNGSDTAGLNEKQRAVIRNRDIGFVFQSYNLLYSMTARENIEVPLGFAGVGKAERRRRADELMEKLGIADRANHHPGSMSGGEQQRVAIARAIANDPKLILADEPTGNLDDANTAEIMEILKKLNADGATIVMVTHDSALLGEASRVVYM